MLPLIGTIRGAGQEGGEVGMQMVTDGEDRVVPTLQVQPPPPASLQNPIQISGPCLSVFQHWPSYLLTWKSGRITCKEIQAKMLLQQH